MRRLPLLLCAAVLAGCAVYPTVRDLARVQSGTPTRRLTAATMPGGDAYLRLVGELIEVAGVVTAVDTSGPVRLTIDGKVLCAFAKDNQAEGAARPLGQPVVVRGILRYDPDRCGWLSPVVVVPPEAPASTPATVPAAPASAAANP